MAQAIHQFFSPDPGGFFSPRSLEEGGLRIICTQNWPPRICSGPGGPAGPGKSTTPSINCAPGRGAGYSMKQQGAGGPFLGDGLLIVS